MAGHMLKNYFTRYPKGDVWTTVRSADPLDSRAIALDVRNDEHLRHLLKRIQPDVVINAVGLLNEEARTRQAEAIYVNSLFPHRLAEFAEQYDFRLFHISTDCVFSGSRGITQNLISWMPSLFMEKAKAWAKWSALTW